MQAAQLLGLGLSELPKRKPQRLIGQDNATFCHERFDIPRTHAETKSLKDWATWPTFSAMLDLIEL
jgi:hypothetical protein